MSDSVAELDEMQAIIEEFLVESDELVDKLDSDLVKLEKDPENLDLLNEIFRSAHTIKGTSGFLGFNDLMGFTHVMEDVLNRLRKGEVKVVPETIDVLLDSIDTIKAMIEDIKEGRDSSVDTADLVARLKAVGEGEVPSANTEVAEPEKKPAGKKKTGGKKKAKATKKSKAEAKAEKEPEEAPAPEEKAPEQKAETKAEKPPAAARKDAFERKKTEQTIRVDVNRLDNLMNMMGELVLGRNSLMQLSGKFNHEYEGEALTATLNQTSTIGVWRS